MPGLPVGIETHIARSMEKRWQDAGSLPTTGTQQSAIAIVFAMTALATVTCVARMYVRFTMKSIGLGMYLALVSSDLVNPDR